MIWPFLKKPSSSEKDVKIVPDKSKDYKIKEYPNGYRNSMAVKKTQAPSPKGGKVKAAKIVKTVVKAKVSKQKEAKAPASKKMTPAVVAPAPAAKKPSAKKIKRELVFAPGEVCFWVYNGPALQSLLDLRVALKTMISKEQYEHHVNKEKNDFSQWVLHILKDEACAKDLLKAKTAKAALKVVEEHLKEYEV
jgi:hypothetical protein